MTTSAGDLGPFTGLRLIHRTPTVELFTGFERNGRRPVVLLALTEQAGADPNWSAEFTDAVAKDATILGPLDIPVHVSDLYGRRPWAASLIAPGRRSAERILAALPGAVPEGTDPSALFAPVLHPGTAPPPTGTPPGEAAAPALAGSLGSATGQPGSAPGQPGSVTGQPGSVTGQPGSVTGQPAGSPTGRAASPPAGIAASGPAQEAVRGTTGQHPVLPPGTPVAFGTPPPQPAAVRGSTGQHPVLAAPLGTPGAQPAIQSTTGQHPVLPSAPPGGLSQGPLPPGAHNPTVPLPPGSPGRPSGQQRPPWVNSLQPPTSTEVKRGRPAGGKSSAPLPAKLRDSHRGVLLVAGAAVAVIVALVCGLGVVFLGAKHDQPKQPSGAAAPAGASAPDKARTPAPPPAPVNRPTVKNDVLPVVVAGGVVFADAEQTVTVDELPLPFAFRTPKNWTCSPTAVLGGRSSDGYACEPSNQSDQQHLVVAVRRCDDGCTAEEQSALDDIWFDRVWRRSPGPRRRDSTTVSAEDPGTASGTYHLVLSHFFADRAGQTPRWQVVVNATAPAKTHIDVQKITNDIRSQTPA